MKKYGYLFTWDEMIYYLQHHLESIGSIIAVQHDPDRHSFSAIVNITRHFYNVLKKKNTTDNNYEDCFNDVLKVFRDDACQILTAEHTNYSLKKGPCPHFTCNNESLNSLTATYHFFPLLDGTGRKNVWLSLYAEYDVDYSNFTNVAQIADKEGIKIYTSDMTGDIRDDFDRGVVLIPTKGCTVRIESDKNNIMKVIIDYDKGDE